MTFNQVGIILGVVKQKYNKKITNITLNGDGNLEKKIKAFTISLIMVIILAAVSAIAVVNGKSVDSVDGINIGDVTSTSVDLIWNPVEHADGYMIYQLKKEDSTYKEIADINQGDRCTYTVGNIDPGSIIDLKITAYKNFNNKKYESKAADEITVYCLPDMPVVSAYSPEISVFFAEWQKQNNAAGYEIEYSKDKDFKEKTEETLTDNSFTLEKATPGATYYIKVRAFIEVFGERVYSEWSKTNSVKIRNKVGSHSDLDPNKPIVALTFDDGPAYYNGKSNTTKEILDVLEKYGAKATFFMVSSRIADENKGLLKRELELGCELGNHTYDHKNYGKNVNATAIQAGINAIRKACGQEPTIFRCPGGIMSPSIQKECERQGVPIAYWSVDTEDWKTKDPEKIYKTTMNNVYDGAIILMHDIYPTTAQAVKRIVPKLISEGYQITTVTEMITVKNGGKPPKSGQQYIDYKTINNNT